jgi:hypothetical protein
MANVEAFIVFTPGHEIQVRQSVDELKALVTNAPRGELAFISVVDIRDHEHWINVREIVEIYDA